jgi:hypothetical protein
MVVIAAAMIGFAFFDPLGLRVASLIVGGLAVGGMSPMVSSLFQARTPAAMLGRVSAMIGGLTSILAPLSVLAAGVMIEVASLDSVLTVIIAGVWLMAASAVLSPQMRAAAPAFDERVAGTAVEASDGGEGKAG